MRRDGRRVHRDGCGTIVSHKKKITNVIIITISIIISIVLIHIIIIITIITIIACLFTFDVDVPRLLFHSTYSLLAVDLH